MKKVILIFGQTGVEKSSTALKLSEGRGEIISADSMQIYKGLNIGTAKLPFKKRRGIPHHLIDILNPDEYYSAYHFQKQAHALINALHEKGKTPFIVGGTGLYFKVLTDGIIAGPPPNKGFREALHRRAQKSESLYQLLQERDKAASQKIHPADTKRIIRALEVQKATKRSIRDLWQEQSRGTSDHQFLKIGLTMHRQALYHKLTERCHRMLSEGLIEEIRTLHDQGYNAKLPAMHAIGYRHFLQYLSGEKTYQRCQEEFIRDSRRFAKRQWTFFKSFPGVHWFETQEYPRIKETVHEFLHA